MYERDEDQYMKFLAERTSESPRNPTTTPARSRLD
jgi:hypothetical protein